MSVPLAAPSDTAETDVRRVLVYRLGSLGDTVVALPALHLVATTFPNAERRMLTNFPVAAKAAPAAGVLERSGLIHSYQRYTVGERNAFRLAALIWHIRRFRPQVLVYMAAARGMAVAQRDAHFFRACGVPRLVGVPLTEAMQQNALLPDGTLEPEAERLVRNLAELGPLDVGADCNWNMGLGPAEEGKAAGLMAEAAGLACIAVSVGTKVQAKDWGAANWHSLLAGLATEFPAHGLVLIGAAEEAAASHAAAEAWKNGGATGPVMNLCGTMSPRESAAALQRCAVFIGHDSGPMHLAAAVGTPCVAIFAARNKPRVWFPHGERHRVLYHRTDCWGCGLETCVEQRRKCLLSITVDEVMGAARDILERPPLG